MIEGNASILWIDDQPALMQDVRELISDAFTGETTFTEATSCADAHAILEQVADTFDLAILDLNFQQHQGDQDEPVNAAGLGVLDRWGGDLPFVVFSAYPDAVTPTNSAGMAPIAYMEKGGDETSIEELIRMIEVAYRWRQAARAADDATEGLRHSCLTRVRGAFVSVRFHLRHLPCRDIPNNSRTFWDFAPLNVGLRHFERAVTSHGGRINSFGGATATAFFPAAGNAPATDWFGRGITALQEAWGETRREGGTQIWGGPNPAPFGAGIVSGMFPMGDFGVRNPGHSAIVGRLPDVAGQISSLADPGEVGVVYQWLNQHQQQTVSALPSGQASKSWAMKDVLDPVPIVFHRIV